jgi:hypothetical protein
MDCGSTISIRVWLWYDSPIQSLLNCISKSLHDTTCNRAYICGHVMAMFANLFNFQSFDHEVPRLLIDFSWKFFSTPWFHCYPHIPLIRYVFTYRFIVQLLRTEAISNQCFLLQRKKYRFKCSALHRIHCKFGPCTRTE